METSLKNGFALLLLPKKSESPKIWGGGGGAAVPSHLPSKPVCLRESCIRAQ